MAQSSKRQDILDATLNLLVKHDIQATSLARIAKEANVGMGTIYNYFESKDVLLSELFRSIRHELHELIFSTYPESGSYEERFLHIWRTLLGYYISAPNAFLFSERFFASSYMTAELAQESAELWQTLNQMFAKAQKERVLKDIPLELFLPMILGALRSTAHSHIRGDISLDSKMTETIITSLWDAVKRPSA